MTTSVEKAIVDISQPDELFVLSLSHLTNHACSQIENGAASQMDLDNVSTLEVTLPVIISLLKNQKDVSEIRVSEFVRSLDSIGNACYSSIANGVDTLSDAKILNLLEQTTLLLTRLVDAKYYFLWSVVEYRLIIVTRSQERIVTSILSKLARPFTPSPFTVIFTAILGNVQRESVASTPTWETFVREMVDAATSSQSLYNRHIFISAASLLNKCSVGTLSVKITENIQLLKTGIQNGQNTSLLMPCFAWLTKALVIQANQKGYSFLGDIISWLSDPSKASFACDAFELIIRDDKDGYLSIKSSCVSKVCLIFAQHCPVYLYFLE